MPMSNYDIQVTANAVVQWVLSWVMVTVCEPRHGFSCRSGFLLGSLIFSSCMDPPGLATFNCLCIAVCMVHVTWDTPAFQCTEFPV